MPARAGLPARASSSQTSWRSLKDHGVLQSARRRVAGTVSHSPPLTMPGQCSLIVLMPIETLGDAMTAGWRVHAKCIDGRVDQTHSTRKCHYTRELNLETLVWTRGRKMLLSDLKDRMMC